MVAALATTVAGGQTQGGASSGSPGRPGGGGGGTVTSHLPPAAPLPAQPRSIPTTALAAVQYRLDLLEEDLRLAPEQRNAWNTYRDRVLRLAEDAQRSARTALGGELAAPQRLDRLADVARDRLTAMEDIVDAGKQLYAVLTPGQKIVADRRMAVPVMALAGVEPAGAGGGPRGAEPEKKP